MQVKLRDVLINRLEAIGHNNIILYEEDGQCWGVCFQLDKYIEELTGEMSYDMEEWIIPESDYYLKWLETYKGEYVSFNDKESFMWEPRRALCLGLAEEIKDHPNLFDEYVEILSEEKAGRYYSFTDFNRSFGEEV